MEDDVGEESLESGPSGSLNEVLIEENSAEESRRGGNIEEAAEPSSVVWHKASDAQAIDNTSEILLNIFRDIDRNFPRPKADEEFPQNFQILSELFDAMIAAYKLHALRSRIPTFQLLSNAVEIYTGKRLLFKHVAQMKYMLPERIQLGHVFITNVNSGLSELHMKISIRLDDKNRAPEKDFAYDNSDLSSLFSRKLKKFWRLNPEATATDVPQAQLPGRFSDDLQAIDVLAVDQVSNDLQAARDPET